MLTVNLISGRRSEQNRYRRIGDTLVRVAIVIGIFTVSYIVFGFLASRRVENQIAQTNLAKIAYQNQADEVSRLQSTIAALAPQVQIVTSSNRELDNWRYVYAQLARSIPENLKLESIDISQESDSSKVLRITGRGDSAKTITNTLLTLNKQPSFSDVVMGAVNLTNSRLATLNASITIKPPPDAASAGATSTPAGQ
jgi:Tfp pilus assembly protein PilN